MHRSRPGIALGLFTLFAPWAVAHASPATATANANATGTHASTQDGKQARKRHDEQAQGLQNVVVTGRSVGFTNNTLPPKMLKLQSALSSVVDAVNVLPGVNVTPGGVFDSDVWSMGITMRGFTQDQLGFTVDGLPNGASIYGGGSLPNRFLDPENLSQVSVSQGTADISSPSLQALGGTLNYISSDPAMQQGMRINYSTGSWHAHREFVRYDTGAILGGSSYAYASVSDTRNQRWIGSGGNGHSNRIHVDSKLISYLSDSLTMTARASFDDAYENNYNAITLQQFKTDPNWDQLTWYWTGKPYTDQNFVQAWNTVRTNVLAGVRFDYQPDDNTTYTFYPYYHFQKGTGGWLPPYQLYAVDANGGLLNQHPSRGASFTKVFFQDANGDPLATPANCADPFDAACYPTGAQPASSFRESTYSNHRYGFIAKGAWDIGANHVLAGVWLQNQDRRNGRLWFAVLDPTAWWTYDHNAYYEQFDQHLQTDSRKLYAQDHLILGDFDLSGGVSKYYVSLTGTDRITGQRIASLNSNSDLLPSLGAVYHLDRRSQLYASWTRNFSPVPDTVLQTAATGSDISHVKPETSTNIDVGYRYAGSRLHASIAAYHVRFANQITFLTPSSDGVTQVNYTIGTAGTYVNVGGVKSKGVEALADWQFTPTLSLYTSATYNDSTYLGNVNGIKQGNKVAGVPERMFVTALHYHSGPYRMGLSGKYVGGRYGTLSNSEKIPSYTSLDGYIGYHLALGPGFGRDKSVDLSLNMTNMLDRRYLGTLSSAGNPGYYFIAPPRTVIFTIATQL